MDKETTKLIKDEVEKQVSQTVANAVKDLEEVKKTLGRMYKELNDKLNKLTESKKGP